MKIFLLVSLFYANSLFAENVKNLETCYSPEGKCEQKLISVLNSSQKTLDIAIYSIDHTGIASAIISAKSRGVTIRMIVDKGQSKKKHSQVQALLKSKIPLKYGNVKGIMHNKYTIVDGAILETGSFNYKNNSSNDNAENQIYITDKSVIKSYTENFDKLWANGLN